MAWRPHKYLLEGELDNTVAGKVTGWMKFAGVKGTVSFDLEGDFHSDIRGARVRLRNLYGGENAPKDTYMDGFALHQEGKVGDMTAGLPPAPYSPYPYFDWFTESNGRVVLELDAEQVEVIRGPASGMPRPWKHT